MELKRLTEIKTDRVTRIPRREEAALRNRWERLADTSLPTDRSRQVFPVPVWISLNTGSTEQSAPCDDYVTISQPSDSESYGVFHNS